ncbi:MAG: hypothetical protein EOO65_05620 [Methanosarcinales archaeon]|nr:MAG: hypothetical protein EOO65_05620 [Methanosarcinales archaeon]
MGEVALKWLEFLHTGLPLPMLSALIGPARLSPQDQATMARVYIPWATRVSTQSVCLLSVRYESLFAKPLAQVRAELNFEPAPQLPYATRAPVHAATPDASAPGVQPSNVRRRVTIL